MGAIKDSLQFQGQWRSYQKRVLDHAQSYGQDHRIHIVAAPGSGKTTLGIELLRRLDAPCLILAPSITIRDQWLSRIREGFFREQTQAMEALLSNQIKKPAPITAITYQALHSCIRRQREEQKGQDEEQEDYSDFDFYATIQRMGIGTICLDEAHHLRSEWWKALEEMIQRLQGVTIISLTATPPYDSTPAQWQRYISLCGPIDEEISVPELVQEKSLCPHQDYVYFNQPTKEELQEIETFRQKSLDCAEQILADPAFAAVIAGHRGLKDPAIYADQLLEKPAYLSAMLIFLQARGIPFSPKLQRLLGVKGKLPPMDLKWMEILLQGFLYEDLESFDCDKSYREQLIEKLKASSLIHRNQVELSLHDKMNKLLAVSKGKLASIAEITRAEYLSMGKQLRQLILTDYIKKEHLGAIGSPEQPVNELGVVPIFEMLRRENMKIMERLEDGTSQVQQLQLAALSGTVVILPERAKQALQVSMAARGLEGSFVECGSTGYFRFTLKGSEETAAALVTQLFQEGYIQVLIGTKSLLGEGWDSPCINALILASFVGSFMLSNQMRGRAIRTMKERPDKVSNIWHLICMLPEKRSSQGTLGQVETSEDFQTLQRRFKGFLGVHYEKNIIEDGLERLSLIRPPFTDLHLHEINEQMLLMASRRDALRQKWETALAPIQKMELVEEVSVPKTQLKNVAVFQGTLLWLLLGGVIVGISAVLFLAADTKYQALFPLLLLLLCGVILLRHGRRIWALASPKRHLTAIGKGIVRALYKVAAIDSKGLRVAVEQGDDRSCYIALSGGTEREKTVFADAVYELFGYVDNQRYLLQAKKKGAGLSDYYCVPELFGRRKEDAQLFAECVSAYLGRYELVYTRNEEGRKILLEARMKALANLKEHGTNRRKRAKSALE